MTASGAAPLSYQWSKNGTAITGATLSSYTTPVETTSDNDAQFTVAVSNSTGSTNSSAATLTVSAAATAPSITSQPASQTVVAGQTATFSVAASGTAPLSYQWSKNGAAIAGATLSSYTTPAETTSDNGALFAVSVSNSTGSTNSSAVTLTVNAATSSLSPSQTSLSFGSINLGANKVLSVTLTNSGNSNVTISNVSITGAGFAASGISTGQVVTPGQAANLSLTFAPASAAGVTGSVTVTSNATNSPTTIALLGTGTQSNPPAVTLSWTGSATSVTGYNVYRANASAGPFSELNASLVSATDFVDNSVQAGQTYYYVATGSIGRHQSAYSNVASATAP